MKISICICTYNRAKILSETLNSFQRLEFGIPYEAELLIVDNRSTDETRNLVEQFVSNCQVPCRYIFEAKQGISNARNRAMAEAGGELIAFVDDDIFFDRSWLIEIVRAFESFPDVVCLSGAVRAHYEVGRPPWLDPDPEWLNMESMFSITLFDETARYLEAHETPVGANFAFRLPALRELGGFSGTLGRHGTVLLSKEETELFFRITRSGQRAASAPKAIVHHRISRERSTKSWLVRRFYWQGISQAVFDQITEPKDRSSLLRDAMRDVRRLSSFIFGGSWSPMKLYWHLRSYRFYHGVFATYMFALIRKRISLALFPGS